MAVFKLSCFMKEEPAILFPLLLPMHFKWSDNHSITWKNEGTEFTIIPFSTRGREIVGYRIVFTGTPEAFDYLLDQFLSRFKPLISGIEWIHSSDKSQSELIRLAENSPYLRCSQYGLYEHKGIGIVLLPSSEINLQIRNQSITTRNVLQHMRAIEETASVFLPKTIDLFSFAEGVEVG